MALLRLAPALIVVALAGCRASKQRSDGSSASADSGDATLPPSDAASEAAADSGDDAFPPFDANPDGRYTQGIYLCCAKGEGRSCCPPETLPDPSIGRIATCFAYGGVLGECTVEGDVLEGKDICSLCCPGLVRLSTCGATPPSILVCTACGDGVCGLGESLCNCPADCT